MLFPYLFVVFDGRCPSLVCYALSGLVCYRYLSLLFVAVICILTNDNGRFGVRSLPIVAIVCVLTNDNGRFGLHSVNQFIGRIRRTLPIANILRPFRACLSPLFVSSQTTTSLKQGQLTIVFAFEHDLLFDFDCFYGLYFYDWLNGFEADDAFHDTVIQFITEGFPAFYLNKLI